MALAIGQTSIGNVYTDVAPGAVLHFDVSNSACYPGSGSAIYDLSGTGNNGTLYNTPAYSSSNSGYLSFNGTNQFIMVPNATSLNPYGSGWSVSMWFNAASVSGSSGGPILYNKENLYEGAHGASSLQIAWQPNWAWVGTSSISAGTWYHLAHVFDNGMQYMYLDGVLTWSAGLTGTMGSTTYDLGIGARGLSAGNGTGASSFGNFSMATFTLYKYAITPKEIRQNYNAAAARFGKSYVSSSLVVESSGALISVATFTGSGTYTVPSNCTKIYVQLVGGGGGAAGYCESGGAGGYAEGKYIVTPGTQYTVTVGGGGSSVGYYAAAGNGGTTSFGSLISATGGYGSNQNYSHGGGHGGLGSGGQVNIYGGSGTGHANSGSHSQAGQAGGGSFFGGAGSKSRGNNADNNSPAFGSGASGGISEIGSTGAVGKGGLVIVYAYK